MATKDSAPSEVVSNLLTTEAREMQSGVTNLKEPVVEGSTLLNDALKQHHSKTFIDLYKAKVSTTQNVEKTITFYRKLLRRLLSVITAGRIVEMVNELSPIPRSLAKPGRETNTTSNAHLINILMAGLQAHSNT